MIETVLTIKKTVDNLFAVNPFFGPNLTILYPAFQKYLAPHNTSKNLVFGG